MNTPKPNRPDTRKTAPTKTTASGGGHAPGGTGKTTGEKIQENLVNRDTTGIPRSQTSLDATTH